MGKIFFWRTNLPPLKQAAKSFILTIAAISILVSSSFKFLNLERHLFWYDETISATRIVGTSEDEIDALFNNNKTTIGEVSKYRKQRRDRNIINVLQSGFVDSQVSPLYHSIVHFWAAIFGDSISSFRSCSIIISLLGILAAYWFGHELLRGEVGGIILASIYAVSPFFFAYAREVRMYSLWSVAIFLVHASFFRALRKQGLKDWGLYTLLTAFSLYAHLLSVFVIATHGIFLAARLAFQRRSSDIKIAKYFLVSQAASLLLFAPWIFIIIRNIFNIEERISWLDREVKIQEGIIHTLGLIAHIFVTDGRDADNMFMRYAPPIWIGTFIILSCVFLSLLSLRSIRNENLTQLLLAATVSFLAFMFIPCVFLDQGMLLIPRYQIPTLIVVQLVIGAWINYLAFINYRVGISLLAALATAGIISSYSLTQEQLVFNKGGDHVLFPAIQIIKESNNPAILSVQGSRFSLMLLTYYLDPETPLILAENVQDFSAADIRELISNEHSLFILTPDKISDSEFFDIPGYSLEPFDERFVEFSLTRVVEN